MCLMMELSSMFLLSMASFLSFRLRGFKAHRVLLGLRVPLGLRVVPGILVRRRRFRLALYLLGRLVRLRLSLIRARLLLPF
jgi:hypothetical protein